MPYYIYRVKPFAQLEKLATFDAFTEASAQAKTCARRAERWDAWKDQIDVCRKRAACAGPAVPGAGCAAEGG
ncbi:MAG: hypothetical protein IPG23_11890 [Burkholderiales bacterium]|nr:hypothetical protein [Burkholderiales bacterium]